MSKIEANELRLGNYFSRLDLVSGENRIERVLELRSAKLLVTGPILVYCNYDEIEPIPITEEWLLKMGFQKYEWVEFGYFIPFIGKHLMIRKINDKLYFTLTRVSADNTGQKMSQSKKYCKEDKYKYVHQIQNLYQANMLKELTIQN